MRFYCQITEFISSPLAQAKLTAEAAKKPLLIPAVSLKSLYYLEGLLLSLFWSSSTPVWFRGLKCVDLSHLSRVFFPPHLPQHSTRWLLASSVSWLGLCNIWFALVILWYEENLRAEEQHSNNCWDSHGCCSNNLKITIQVLLLKMVSHNENQHLCLQWQLTEDEGEAGKRWSWWRAQNEERKTWKSC